MAISLSSVSTVGIIIDEIKSAVGKNFTDNDGNDHIMRLDTHLHFSFNDSLEDHPEWFVC